MQQGLGASAAADRAFAATPSSPQAVSPVPASIPLRVLSLFAGIGGFDLGLERTGGFQTVAFCEIDPHAQRILRKHWPDIPCYEDVTNLTAERLGADGIAVDVICGGFPCQDLSASGKQVGLEGERSGLWGEIVRLARDIRPRFLLVENVANLLVGERGGWFSRLLGDLAGIGYDAEWYFLPASWLGAPHARTRVWIVAYPHEVGRGSLALGFDTLRQFERRASEEVWVPELSPPAICRVDDGIPDRVDRLARLGNAVVPQIPELIGNAILSAIADTHRDGGDSTKIEAPFMSGSGARSAIAQGPAR